MKKTESQNIITKKEEKREKQGFFGDFGQLVQQIAICMTSATI